MGLAAKQHISKGSSWGFRLWLEGACYGHGGLAAVLDLDAVAEATSCRHGGRIDGMRVFYWRLALIKGKCSIEQVDDGQ